MADQRLSTQQAATYLGVSTKTLTRWEQNGILIPERTLTNQRRYSLSALEDFKQRYKQPPPPINTQPSEVNVTNSVEPASQPAAIQAAPSPDSDPVLVAHMQGLESEHFTMPTPGIIRPKLNTFAPSSDESSIDMEDVYKSSPLRKLNKKYALPFIAGILFFIVGGIVFGTTSGLLMPSLFGNPTNSDSAAKKTAQIGSPAARPSGRDSLTGDLLINIPTLFSEKLTVKNNFITDGKSIFNDDIKVNNKNVDLGSGKLTASNVVYSMIAGANVSITGSLQNPTISASFEMPDLTNIAVTSLQGKTGSIQFTGGTGISLDGLKINNTGVLSLGGQTGEVTLAGGDGITVSGTTITNDDPGSAQNIFKNIIIDTTVLSAASNDDTLRFEAGTGIVLTPNVNGKSITIAANSSGTGNWSLAGTDIFYNAGNVGIGTSTPASALDVTGNVTVTGNASVSGNLSISSFTQGVLHADANGLLTSTALNLAGGASEVTGLLPVGNGGTGIATTPSAGQLLIGNGTNYDLANLTGTANQISISNAPGSITFSTPQDIHSAAAPTFASLNLTNTTDHLVFGIGNTGTLTSEPLTANRTYTLPDISGTFCLSSGNCGSGGGGGTIVGSGTTNYLVKFTSSTGISDSLLYESGGKIGLGTTSPQGLFQVSGAPAGNALTIFDYTGTGENILVGSSSGATKFVFDSSGNLNLTNGSYQIGQSNVLNSTTLGDSILNSSLIDVGALESGSIVAGFGNIDVGSDSISGGDITATNNIGFTATGNESDLTFSGLGNHDILATSGSLRIGAASLIGDINAGSNSITGLNNLSASGTVTFSGLTTGVVFSNGSGELSTSALNLGGGSSYITGSLPAENGGTGIASYTAGDLLVATSGTTLAPLNIGTDGQVLVVSGGSPSWTSASSFSYWQQNAGALSPLTISDNLFIGGTTANTATFQIYGSSGNASASGSLTFNTPGSIQTTRNQTLTIGGDTTGNIVLSPRNGNGNMTVTGNINLSNGKTYQINGTDVLSASALGTGVTGSYLTSVGDLTSGSISSGFGDILTSNAITGSIINATDSIRTGAGAGTVRITETGDLVNIGTTELNSVTYSWPGADGSGDYVLTTNGAGGLSWNTVSSLTGAGDITAIGDVISGEAFTAAGTQGTSLYFYDPDGRGQLTTANLTAPRTYTLPNESGTVCLTTGNCIGSGGAVGGNGFAGQIAYFSDSSTLESESSGFTWDAINNKLGIGTDSPLGKLSVAGNASGKALVIIDESGDQDILVGSASGTTRFVFDRSGNLNLTNGAYQIGGNTVLNSTSLGNGITNSQLQTLGTISTGTWQASLIGSQYGGTGANLSAAAQGAIPYFSATGVMSALPAGQAGYVLTTNGANQNPTWTEAAGLGTNYWDRTEGALSPKFATVNDLLLGSNATSSAKFAFINVNSGVPTASISANTPNNASYLTGDGILATTNRQSLTIGSPSTGDIVLSGFGAGVLQTNPSGIISTGSINVSNGGTGVTTFASNGVIFGNGTGALQATTAGTDGQMLLGQSGGAPVFRTLGGDASVNSADGTLTIGTNAVALGADTAGDYVASITSGNGIAAAASGEGSTPTISLAALNTSDWDQTGAYDIVLNNAGSEIRLLESSGGTYFATLDAGDLDADKTYILPNFTGASASICLSTGNCAGTGGSITGAGTASQLAFFTDADTINSDSSLYFDSTNKLFGIGTASPVSKLDVNSSVTGKALVSLNETGDQDIFTASSSGTTRFVIANNGNVTASGTFSSANFSGTSSGTNTGDVTLSGENYLSIAGQTITANAVNLSGSHVTGILPIANGGTNKNLTLSDGGIVWTDADSFEILNAHSNAGLALVSGGAGSPSWFAPDAGSIIFSGANGALSQDNASLFFDDTANRLGIGVNSNLLATLDIRGQSGTLPIASLSGQTSTAGFIVDNNGVGDLFTASKSGAAKFTILNDGNIRITNLNGCTALETDSSGLVTCGTDDVGVGGGGNSNWQITDGALSPINGTLDLLLGSSASSTAKFAFLNVNTGSGVPTASIAGTTTNNSLFLTGEGTLSTTNKQTLTLGTAATGNVLVGGNGLFVSGLGSCDSIDTDADGKLICGTDAGGSGSAGVVNIQNNGTPVGTSVDTINFGTQFSVSASPTTRANVAIANNVLGFGELANSMTLDATTDIGFGGFNLTLGTNSGNGGLIVSPNAGGKAALIVDKLGTNDIFSASSSGATKFTIAANGNLTATGTVTGLTGLTSSGAIRFSNMTTPGGLLYTDGSGNVSQTAGSSGQCLTGGATPSWSSCDGASASFWQLAGNALTPGNATYDLFVGGTSTASAKFALTNMTGSGTPTASISAQSGNNSALVLDANSTIQSVRNQTLTLGGSTTGNILLNENISIAGNIDTSGNLTTGAAFTINGSSYVRIGDTATPGSATTDNDLFVEGDTEINGTIFADGNITLNNTSISDGTDGVDIADDLDIAGNTTFGDAASDTLTFTAQVAQDSDLIPVTTTGTNDLGSSGVPWDNLYAVSTNLGGTILDVNSLDFTGAGTITTGGGTDLTLDAAGNNIVFANTDSLIIGGHAGNVAYNVISDAGGSPASGQVASDNDLYIQGTLEAGALYQGANQVCDTSGNCAGTTNYWQLNSGTLAPGNAANATDRVIIGGASTTTPFQFEVNGKQTGKALVSLNETGNQDILTGSASGTTQFTFGSTGNLSITGDLAINGGNITTATTFDSTLTVTGLIDFNNAGINDIAGTLNLSGNTLASSGDLTIDPTGGGVKVGTGTPNAVDLAGDDLYVTGDTELDGTLFAHGNITLNNTSLSDGIDGVDIADDLDIAGNTTFGDATSDTLTFTARVAQDSDLIPVGTTGTNDLGSSGVPWDNLFVSSSNLGGTILDINSLDFTGAGTITTGAGTDLTLNPADEVIFGDTKNLIIGGHAGNVAYNVLANLGEAPEQTDIDADNDLFIGGSLEVDGIIYQGDNQVCDTSGNCASVTPTYWNQNSGVITQKNTTVDFLVGGTATSSAKFAVLNMNPGSGIPTASVSGTSGGAFLTAAGKLQTTAKQTLTLGGGTTGNVVLEGFAAGALQTNASGVLSSGTLTVANGGTGATTLGAGGILYGNGSSPVASSVGSAGQVLLSGGAGTPTWTTGALALAGNFTTVNANNITLTTNGLTSLILPTTGTLATLAGTETLSNKTLTTPRFADLGYIADANGNELLILDTVASAVNEITLANATTTNGPTLTATGGDTNIALTINSKGTGNLDLNGTATGNILLGGGSAATGCTVTNASGNFACAGTLTGSNFSGSSSGTNTGDQTITLTGDVTGSGNGSFAATIADNAVDGTDISLTSEAQGDIMYFNGTDWVRLAQAGANGILHSGTTPSWGAVDLSTAQVSNTLPIARGGTNSSAVPTNGGVAYGTGTAYAFTSAGSNGECLLSNGASQPTWGNCNGGSQEIWKQNGGTISPYSSTLDMFVGGTATSSAKFSVLNMTGSGTPTASVSATTGNGVSLAGNGTIQSLKMNTLTLGGTTTGNILLTPANGAATGMINTTSNINLASGRSYQIAGIDVLSAGALGNNVLASQLTSVGILNAGSIIAGFGAIDTGSDNISGGNITSTGTTGFVGSGAGAGLNLSGTGTHVIQATGTLQINAFNMGGSITGGNNDITGLGQLTVDSIRLGTTTTNTIDTSGGDLILAAAGGDIIFSDNNTLNIGGNGSDTAYNAIGDNLALASANVNSDDDLYIEGNLEVDGTVNFGALATNGGVLFTNGGNVSQTTAGSSGQCLQSAGGSTPTWGSCDGAGSISPFTIANGLLYNGNITTDFAIGGISSNSAKFKVSVSGTQPTASVAGKTSYAGLVVNNDGFGDLFTASKSGKTHFTIRNSGTVVIGNSTNGITLDPLNGGMSYAGNARKTKTISLQPEYPGSVLTAFYGAGTDTNISGLLTSDMETTGTNNLRGYYQWERTTDATQHFYTVAVRVRLPKDFAAWTTSNAIQVDYVTESATNTNSDLDVRVYIDNDASLASTDAESLNNASTSWSTINIAGSSLNEVDAADETAVIYLRMGSGGSFHVRIGEIRLNYLASF